jgi:hypothetical protein
MERLFLTAKSAEFVKKSTIFAVLLIEACDASSI